VLRITFYAFYITYACYVFLFICINFSDLLSQGHCKIHIFQNFPQMSAHTHTSAHLSFPYVILSRYDIYLKIRFVSLSNHAFIHITGAIVLPTNGSVAKVWSLNIEIKYWDWNIRAEFVSSVLTNFKPFLQPSVQILIYFFSILY
jgi:hypothetical protein